MAVNFNGDIKNINSYLVNQLFNGSNNQNTSSNNNIVSTLQNLSEDYAEISAFGQKLNTIYNTLTGNNASQEALNGARNVFLNIIKSPEGMNGLETIDYISNLNSKPSNLQQFFELSNKINENNLNLNGWLESFKNADNYGFEEQFLNETQNILNSSNDKDKLTDVFNNFLQGVAYATNNSPATQIAEQSLTNLFNGLQGAQTLEEKNQFLTKFIGGFSG